jgi:hypothetical protein
MAILYMQYVWIDSFFELRCFGAMLWFPVQLDSWWSSISFTLTLHTIYIHYGRGAVNISQFKKYMTFGLILQKQLISWPIVV